MTTSLNEEAGPPTSTSKLRIWIRSCCLIPMNPGVLFATLAFCLIFTVTSAQENEVEKSWPREIQTSEGTVVIYQPQLESLEGDVLKGRAAFSLRVKKDDEPEFGALWFSSKVAIDRDDHIAIVSNTTIPLATLSESTDTEKKELAQAIEEKVSAGEMSLSLDRLIAALSATDQERKEAAEIRTAPPIIIISKTPAVLVYIDGDPAMIPIQGTKFLQVENSPFPIVLDPKTKAFYLNGGDIWYKATDVLGPWKNVDSVPNDVSALLELSEEEKKQLKGDLKDERIPKIVVATEPTELIFIDGETKFTPLVGTELLYVQNSETPLFFDTETEDYYVLLSGRWYASSGLDDTQAWDFVPPDELPEAFADIPHDSNLAEVRSNVAGTDEAEEAVLNANIPQTSAINRGEAKLEVSYNGKPEFEPITNTTIKRAVNTQFTVMKIGGLYYAVDQAIWFVSESPEGPWVVADEVPEEVEEIPPSSPVYNVKFVKVYDSTADYVYYGYTPGYVGSYVLGRTVVYGTGYWYRCGWRRSYYACPLTWGFGAIYRPWAGWTFGLSYTRFHFHIGFRGGYRWHGHHHGRYRYRNGWWGPGGYHSRRYVDHRRRHHNAAHARHRRNVYNRPDNRKHNHFKDRRPAKRPGHKIAQGRANNVFADRKGNVYRRTRDGWQKRDGKKWVNAKLPDRRPGDATRPGRPGNSSRPGRRPGARPGQTKPSKPPGGQAKPPQRPNKTKPAGRPGDTKRPARRPANKSRPAKKTAKAKPAQRPSKAKAKATKQTKKRPSTKRPAKRPRQTTKSRPQKTNRRAVSHRRKKSTHKRTASRKRSHNVKRHSRARSRGDARSRARRGGGRGGGRQGGGRRRG